MTYEIQDDRGTLHTFTDVLEADTAWDALILTSMEMSVKYGADKSIDLIEQYAEQRGNRFKWIGTLKLVQVHRIHR